MSAMFIYMREWKNNNADLNPLKNGRCVSVDLINYFQLDLIKQELY